MGENPLKFMCRLRSREDIEALFRMTPYAWKTPKEGIERLLEYQQLDVTAQFRVLAFRREV